ncbi:MAG TPA: DinB family protein [Gemmatimonadales bacterium]|jgi:uncharacterized damage-inducible protein DinB|nr:DinB family protein [Gemmatimonadales bacterium]
MTECLEAVAGNLEVLRQGVELLRRMDDGIYGVGDPAAGRSPVGAHFRHVLDHYRSFLSGLATGEIDYDARERNTPLERDRELAIAAALGYMADLERLPADLADRPVRVTLRSVAAADESPDWSGSTVKRELQFLVSHTVHHYALIKELLGQQGLEAGEAFGVAPSTLAARRRDAPCAP